MAEPLENKGDLTDKLEADRQEMAIQVTEVQQSYNVPRWFRASVQEYPWGWMLGSICFGFLLSHLPARKKKVYVWIPVEDASTRNIGSDSFRGKKAKKAALKEEGYPDKDKKGSSLALKLWSIIKPIVTAYLAREIYRRLGRLRSNLSTA